MPVDEAWVNFAHQRSHPKFPPPKNNRKQPHTPNTNIVVLKFLAIKIPDFRASGAINSSGFCVVFWVRWRWLRRGGCVHGITMLMVEAVGIGVGERVEGFGGGGKGERNGPHVMKIES